MKLPGARILSPQDPRQARIAAAAAGVLADAGACVLRQG